MKKSFLLAGAMLTAGIASAEQKPAAPSASTPQDKQDTQHMHHGGFMQEGMHHGVAKGVRLDAKMDAAHNVTLSVGPLTLPAHTSHRKMPQPPDLVWRIPFDGWLLAYHPKLVNASGNSVPGSVLHHVAFWNENRADFLCPNKEEHIFGAGSEMTDWAEVPGYGYYVQKNDKIRIETMVYNPTDTSYDNVFLEVSIPFQEEARSESGQRPNENARARTPKNVYPAWMDVKACGDSSYDVPAGKSEKTGTVTVKYDGVLLGVGGHLHDYGRQLVLENVSRKEMVATLDAKVDTRGLLEAVPVKLFLQEGGYKFDAGDVLKISAAYDNPTGELLREGAMGIAVGYFVPADDHLMAALRRPSKPAAHNMAGMSHDH